MTDFAARPNGTMATTINKIIFKSFTFTTQILLVVMFTIQGKPKKKSELKKALHKIMHFAASSAATVKTA